MDVTSAIYYGVGFIIGGIVFDITRRQFKWWRTVLVVALGDLAGIGVVYLASLWLV